LEIAQKSDIGAVPTASSKKSSRRTSCVELSDDSDEEVDIHATIPSCADSAPSADSWKAEFNSYLDTVEFVNGNMDPLAWWGVSFLYKVHVPMI
jgi:hypothetical protein